MYTLHTSDQFQLRTDKMAGEGERSSVIHIFRKQIFDAIKVLRKDKEKRPDGKTIYKLYHSTQCHQSR